ncbi:hypothetical protein ACLOJK_034613 [Asimina triloba]
MSARLRMHHGRIKDRQLIAEIEMTDWTRDLNEELELTSYGICILLTINCIFPVDVHLSAQSNISNGGAFNDNSNRLGLPIRVALCVGKCGWFSQRLADSRK